MAVDSADAPDAHARFRLEHADVLAAARLHQTGAFFSFRMAAGVLAFAAAASTIFVFALASFGDAPGREDIPGTVAVGATIPAYYLFAFLYARWRTLPRAVRRLFAEQKSLGDDYTVTLSEHAFAVRGAAVQSVIPWPDYTKWREDERVFLLYQSSQYYQIVPKRSVPVGVVDAVRRHLLRAKVPAAGRILE